MVLIKTMTPNFSQQKKVCIKKFSKGCFNFYSLPLDKICGSIEYTMYFKVTSNCLSFTNLIISGKSVVSIY